MPAYDYKCKKCGHFFEARHGMNDPAPECPQQLCGGVVQRVYHAPPAHFHGSGWAKDGYENKNVHGLLKKGGMG
jgi:hypothetical protein